MNRFVIGATALLAAMFLLGIVDQAIPGALQLQVPVGAIAFSSGLLWPELKGILR